VYVEASIRPWFTSGVALVGASAIALTPMAPSSPSLDVRGVTAAVSREFQLTALDIPYIFTLPIVRVGTPATPEPEASAATDPAPASDPSDEVTTPAGALTKKLDHGTSVKDASQEDEKAAGAASGHGVDKDAGKKDAGTDAKPASDRGVE
jgi:hypothetical protein